MPTYTPANSDAARLSNLDTILTTSKLENAEAKLLPTGLQTRVEDFLPIYRRVVLAVDAAMAGRAKGVSEKDLAKTNLNTHVQDFFEVRKRTPALLNVGKVAAFMASDYASPMTATVANVSYGTSVD